MVGGEYIDQKKLIHDTDWDVLLVLDACRFDKFEKVWKKHLAGGLSCVVSPARHTTEWVKKVFSNDGFKDVTYISGNPYITSKKRRDLDGYHPCKYFHSVVDCWDFDFVHPRYLQNTYFALPRKDNRVIVHYMQPHSPYVFLPTPEKKHPLFGMLVRKTIGVRNYNLISAKTVDKLRKEKRESFEPNVIIDAYMDNLVFVLSHIGSFVSVLKGKKIVITSDHGEFLFEDGLYGHGDNLPRRSELVDVPWLEVEI